MDGDDNYLTFSSGIFREYELRPCAIGVPAACRCECCRSKGPPKKPMRRDLFLGCYSMRTPLIWGRTELDPPGSFWGVEMEAAETLYALRASQAPLRWRCADR